MVERDRLLLANLKDYTLSFLVLFFEYRDSHGTRTHLTARA